LIPEGHFKAAPVMTLERSLKFVYFIRVRNTFCRRRAKTGKVKLQVETRNSLEVYAGPTLSRLKHAVEYSSELKNILTVDYSSACVCCRNAKRGGH
jgi:hypothetical protein